MAIRIPVTRHVDKIAKPPTKLKIERFVSVPKKVRAKRVSKTVVKKVSPKVIAKPKKRAVKKIAESPVEVVVAVEVTQIEQFELLDVAENNSVSREI